MQDNIYKNIILNSPSGFAYYKILVDEKDIPIDYEYLEVNPAFEQFFDIDANQLYHEPASKIYLKGLDAKFNWLDFYSDIALQKTSKKSIEFYIEASESWYEATAYSPEKYYVACSFEEITNRKVKEQRQLASINQMKLLTKDLPILVCAFLPDSTLTYVNHAYASYFDSTPEVLHGKRFFDFLPKEVAQSLLLAYQKLSPEKPIHISDHPVKKGEETMWHKWIDRAYFDAHGEVIEYQAVGLDITDQIKAEQQLKESEVNFRLLFENSPIGTYIASPDGTILDLNPTFLKLIGAPSVEAARTRSNLLTFPPLVKAGFSNVFQTCVEQKEVVQKEQFYRTSWGAEKYFSVYAFPLIDEDDKVSKVYGLAEDITDRKETEIALKNSETNFRLLFENSPIGVYIAQPDGTILDANATFLKYTGAPAIEEVREAVNLISFPSLVKAGLSELFQKCIHNKKIQQKEHSFTTHWGKRVYLSNYIFPLLNEEGEVTKVYGLTEDIGERKKAERELRAAKAQAERASGVKSEFLANMSHEIRTPLNGVIGFTDLLSNTSLNSLQQNYVRNANTSAHALLEIINDILDFSKIEADKIELEIRENNILQLVEQATDIVRYQASMKGLNLLLSIDEKMPAFVELDSMRLKQILVNLLSNAIKFTDKGEVELSLYFEAKTKEIGAFKFSVRDTGIGISGEQQKKLFKAFSQADSSTSRKFGGTGLGLIISQRLTQKMGGNIEFSSVVGEESTFFFTLEVPYKKETQQLSKPIDNKHLFSVLSGVKATILVAEDNAVNMLLTKTMLHKLMPHVTVIKAENGKEAIISAKQQKTDLILMDIQMPEVNGIVAAKEVRLWEKNNLYDPVPIIALTAGASKKERSECLAVGMNDFITKPYQRQRLLDILDKYLVKK